MEKTSTPTDILTSSLRPPPATRCVPHLLLRKLMKSSSLRPSLYYKPEQTENTVWKDLSSTGASTIKKNSTSISHQKEGSVVEISAQITFSTTVSITCHHTNYVVKGSTQTYVFSGLVVLREELQSRKARYSVPAKETPLCTRHNAATRQITMTAIFTVQNTHTHTSQYETK